MANQKLTCAEVLTKASDWTLIKQPTHKTHNLEELLEQKLQKRSFTDVIVSIGSQQFHCHRDLLLLSSKFFKEKYSNSTLRTIALDPKYITPAGFEFAYNWMIDKHLVRMLREMLLEILRAAEYLLLPKLKQYCWHYLSIERLFGEDQAFILYLELRQYNSQHALDNGSFVADSEPHTLQNLPSLMWQRIKRFFLTLVSSADFLNLNVDEVCSLLSANTVAVNTEIEILYAAVRWLSADWEARKFQIDKVIDCVRFNGMPMLFLFKFKHFANDEPVSVQRVANDKNVTDKVNSAIHYNVMLKQYGPKSETFLKWLSANSAHEPWPRMLVLDRQCDYHHYPACGSYGAVTYKQFTDYLEAIRNNEPNHWQKLILVMNERPLHYQNRNDSNCCNVHTPDNINNCGDSGCECKKIGRISNL